ncbi:MAG: glycosyltransferase [Candidatus Dormibacteria bacterium]
MRLIEGRWVSPRLPLDIIRTLAGEIVPEAWAWSGTDLGSPRAKADLLVIITTRAFHPRVLPMAANVVLDYVDCLSNSYVERAELTGSTVESRALRTLAWAQRRTERHLRERIGLTVAAGRADAEALGAAWIPNLVTAEPAIAPGDATVDLVFFGNLGYGPNLEALQALADCWPELVRSRPGTTAMVAGRRPGAKVKAMAARLGWDLVPDFQDLRLVCSKARLAVFPLAHASGIQNKALDAAALGLAQVSGSVVLAGLDPEFPLRVEDTRAGLVAAIRELLDDPKRRQSQADTARAHVLSHYTAQTWAPRLNTLLSTHPSPAEGDRD